MLKKSTFFFMSLIAIFSMTQAQVWNQIGNDIYGDAVGDQSGYSVSLNQDGSVMALGAPKNDGNGSNSGQTRIFENQSGNWIQLGNAISGEAEGDLSGFSVSLNADGNRVAIGAIHNSGSGTRAGHVRIFEYNGTDWVQLGSDIDGESSYDWSGYSVRLSNDGNKVVIGAYGNDANGANTGHARVFQYNSSDWIQLGSDIDGTSAGDYAGRSVSISGNGWAVAVGSEENDDNGSNSGHARVFHYNGSDWELMGSPINGIAPGDYFGSCVSLNGDGYVLAVGAPGLDGNASGYTRIFHFTGVEWVQLGNNINGEYFSENSGSSISLQGNGGYIAIGAPGRFNGDDAYGRVRIFKYVGDAWIKLGEDIINYDTNSNELGYSVNMASNSYIVASGGPSFSYVSGGAKVHELIYPPNITQQPASQENICLGNDVSFLVLGTDVTSLQWQVDEGSGFTNLSNNLTYGGVDSPELYITGVTLSMNNNQYRCVLSNSDGDVYSDTVLLATDSENPAIESTHEDQTLDADNNCQTTLPDYTGNVIATDNCSANLDVLQIPAPGTMISGETNTITLSVTDEAGNSAEVSFNIDVQDVTAPLITSSHADRTLDAGDNCETSLPDYTNEIMAADNCDTGLAVIQTPSPGTTVTGETNTVTLTATDDAGNFAEVSFNVGVEDNTNPQITSAHSDQTLDASEDCLSALPDYTGDVVATDNCDTDLTISQTPADGTMISGTVNPVTLTVTDNDGNFAEATFNVEVVDNTNPEITSLHTDQSIEAGDNCQTLLPDYTGDVTATDNCDSELTITQAPAPGSIISGGIHAVTFTATDDAGNFAEVSFNVEVLDVTKPVIVSNHNDQIVYAGENCETTILDYTIHVAATDNCDTNLDITQEPAPGSTISGSSNLVTLTATDNAGNFAEASFNVLVEDNTPPVITSAHTMQTLDADDNCQAILPDYTDDVTATDNCDTDLEITQMPAPGSVVSGFVNIVTLRATDAAGNFSEVSFDLEILDVTKPVITSTHEDQTLEAYENCQAVLPSYNVGVSATDNCDNDLDVVQTPAPATLLSGPVNEVTITVTDDAGNFAEVTFNVAVQDNSHPVITSTHDNQTISADENCQGVLPDYTGQLTATDNCDADQVVTQVPEPGSLLSGTDNSVTLTVTDNSGNASNVNFWVYVSDDTSPEISCVEDQTVDVGDSDYYPVQGTEFDPLEYSDNCQVTTIENDFNFHSSLNGIHIPAGDTTITWTVTDASGNTASCIFNVTVNSSVGIDHFQSKGITIYPNPSNGLIHFKFGGNDVKRLIVSDITGKKIMIKTQVKQEEIIDLSDYENGIYIIGIQTNKEIINRLLIKE